MTFPSGIAHQPPQREPGGLIRLAARVAGFDRNQWLRRHRAHDVPLAPPQNRAEHIAREVHRVRQRSEYFIF